MIIALHQPITRTEIEEIRGVALSQTSMDILLEMGLILPWGRRETPGRPTLWVKTPQFLAQFGLRSLRDIPGADLFSAVGKRGLMASEQGAFAEQPGGQRNGIHQPPGGSSVLHVSKHLGELPPGGPREPGRLRQAASRLAAMI